MTPGDDAYPILRAPAKGQVATRRNIAYPFLRVGWPGDERLPLRRGARGDEKGAGREEE
ncbi:hypothetical protein CBM2623_B10067 [Cupriavidus taiwanensis]|nr:hypothetical protein CBM2608_B10064 [Cupriavidus taiwanensis]SPA31876.1 hypothetical protein CBM2623_B10067 [Cupriavidus taiwanensis]